MSKLVKILSTSAWGIIAGFNGYCASDYFSKVRNIRDALQTQLTNGTKLTQSVREAAEKMASEDYIAGIVSAVVASGALGYCIYSVCRKDKNRIL